MRSELVTNNLKNYMSYAALISEWDQYQLSNALVIINGSKQSLFNYVFCEPGLTEAQFLNILEKLNELEAEATWLADNYLSKVKTYLEKYNIPLVSTPKKVSLNLKSFSGILNTKKIEDFSLEEIVSLEQLKALDKLTACIFFHEEGITPLFLRGLVRTDKSDKGKLLVFFAKIKEEIVGSCVMYMQDGVAGFYGDGVLPIHRNQGIGTQLILERIKIAQAYKCHTAIAHCMPASVNVYQRIGFRILGNLPLYVSEPSK